MDRRLMFASLDSPAQSVLLTNVSFATMLGEDRLAYVRDGKLLSQRFDSRKGVLTEAPVTLADDLNYFYPTAKADFDTSRSGVVIYRTDTSKTRLVTMNRGGLQTRLVEDEENVFGSALSPKGGKAAVTVVARGTGLMDIWIYDLTRGTRDRFTSEPGIEVSPAWSPDGRSIVYSQNAGGSFPHLVVRALTASTPEELTPRDSFQLNPVFSSAGETLFFDRNSGSGNDIYQLDMTTKKTEPVIAESYDEAQSDPSPDGKWLAFTSNATGSNEIYLQSLSDRSVRIRISSNNGRLPRWCADGKELVYLSASNTVMSVEPGAGGRWDEAVPRELFQVQQRVSGIDVFPDGQAFLISTWIPGADDDLFHVVIAPE